MPEIESRVNKQVKEIQVDEAAALLQGAAPPILIDVRETHEWDTGYITGAVHIPRGSLPERIDTEVGPRDQSIILYCAAGVRSLLAAETLEQLGYTRVVSLSGGIAAWDAAGLPVAVPAGLSPAQHERYSRHILLPEVGLEGQKKLLRSKVLLVGAGGLGSPAALYLAAAGIGHIGIVDADHVEVSNLQRQIVHNSARVGAYKTASAGETIRALNPDVEVVEYRERLQAENVAELIAGYDVIVDGADNFPTRYVLNDAGVLLRKPVVHGSIYRFEGQVTVFTGTDGPCYRCLYPEPPPPGMAPSCAEGGVLGVLPGVIGTLQATEVIKLLLRIGDPLIGRILLYDALEANVRDLRVARDPECPVCGDNPTITTVEESAIACARL